MATFHDTFPAIPFDKLETLAFTVRTFANIGSRQLRTEEQLYEGIGLAGSMDGSSVSSWIPDSLTGPL